MTLQPPSPADRDFDGAAEVPIEIAYDGPDYRGEMSASQLSTVLEGASEYAQALIGVRGLDTASRARFKVRAFDSGSFDVNLILQVMGVAKEFLETAAILGGGFAWWHTHMRLVVVSIEHQPDRGTVQVTLQSGEVQEWTETQWLLYNNARARKAIRKMLRPLREGATSMRVIEPQAEITLRPADVERFDDLPPTGPIVSRMTVAAVPDTVRFDPSRPWRLDSKALGGFTAIIEDRSFLQGIELNRIRVGKNDTFVLSVRAEADPSRDSRVHYFVERVVEHIPGGEQHELPGGTP